MNHEIDVIEQMVMCISKECRDEVFEALVEDTSKPKPEIIQEVIEFHIKRALMLAVLPWPRRAAKGELDL